MVKKELEEQVLQLPTEDRTELVKLLPASLEGTVHGEFDAEWAAEARRRLDAFRQGAIPASPAQEVLQRIRSGIQ